MFLSLRIPGRLSNAYANDFPWQARKSKSRRSDFLIPVVLLILILIAVLRRRVTAGFRTYTGSDSRKTPQVRNSLYVRANFAEKLQYKSDFTDKSRTVNSAVRKNWRSHKGTVGGRGALYSKSLGDLLRNTIDDFYDARGRRSRAKWINVRRGNLIKWKTLSNERVIARD